MTRRIIAKTLEKFKNDIHKLNENKKIILFDGVCNLCNGFVAKAIRLDKKKESAFVSIQSETGSKILSHLQIDPSKTDSIVLYIPESQHYIKSSAVLKILNSFGGVWKLMQIFWLIPKPIRDFIYDFIARNRYKWFGKNESCEISSEK